MGFDHVLRLTSLSFAHPAVPANRRAQLSLSGEGMADAHDRLRASGRHAFLLSTCLRMEIAWEGEDRSPSGLLGCLYGDDSVASIGTIRTDEAAFVHLGRIAAGLDSPMVGETEVLAQFRQAVSLTIDDRIPTNGSGPGPLARVLEAAVGIGRTARQLLEDTPRGSLGALAARTAMRSGRVAILGGGAMARAAVDQLAVDLDHGNVEVFARRPGTVGGRPTLSWERALEALRSFPVVISTVPGVLPLFANEEVNRVLNARTEPLMLIDLGMPPGFPSIEPSPSLVYLGVDDVASSVPARPALEAEEKIVRGAAAVWRRLTVPDQVGAVISAMMEQADTAVSEEVVRFANRLQTGSDPDRVLRQLAHSVARRVLHGPISYVGSTDRGVEAVEVLAEAFGITTPGEPTHPDVDRRQ